MEMELADKSLKNEIYENLDQEQRTLKTPLTDEKYKQICTQLLQNMLSMHNNNIVHRDIKLDNILVINRYSDYVLADFGVAEEITNLHENWIECSDSFSIVQSVAGTPQYFSPILRKANQSQQKVVKHDPFKSDIYSMGLILLEIHLLRQGYALDDI